MGIWIYKNLRDIVRNVLLMQNTSQIARSQIVTAQRRASHEVYEGKGEDHYKIPVFGGCSGLFMLNQENYQ